LPRNLLKLKSSILGNPQYWAYFVMGQGRLSDTRPRYVSFLDATLFLVRPPRERSEVVQIDDEVDLTGDLLLRIWQAITVVTGVRESVEEIEQFELDPSAPSRDTSPGHLSMIFIRYHSSLTVWRYSPLFVGAD
jgi:hypothetical protein